MAISKKDKDQEQNALAMALAFITDRLELKDTYLNAQFGLNRCSLCKIRKGEDVPRAHEYFMHAFVKILYDQREAYLTSMDYERANVITRLLCDMLLAEYGFQTVKHQKNGSPKNRV